jgi:drug/metabolite transporter (DMT)-like permease
MPERPISRSLLFGVLGVGLLAISVGAILARLAQGYGMPSLVVATLRLGLAALIVTPVAWWRSRRALRTLDRRQWMLAAGAGVFLALHFTTWISSLEYTSVASSTALVTTNPVWIALASLVLGERPSRVTVAGIAVSLLGSSLIFWSDSRGGAGGSNALLGNALALAGSGCFSGYLLAGRRLRTSVPLLAYVWLAYGVAALFLLLACLMGGVPVTGYGAPAYLVALALAFAPQLIGQTAYNWSLRYVSATFVAVVTLGEPVGSAFLAWVIFAESFAPLQAVGFVALLGGIYLAATGEMRRS